MIKHIDIVDALQYSVLMSVNGLGQVVLGVNHDMDKLIKAFRQFKSLIEENNIQYHKTKEFRRDMYYRRYKRNFNRSKSVKLILRGSVGQR